jgi:hypothetical protein
MSPPLPPSRSPEEVRRYSEILLAYCRELRLDAEAARRRGAECREIANRAAMSAALRYASVCDTLQRLNDRLDADQG